MRRVGAGVLLILGGLVALHEARQHRPPARIDIAKSFGGGHPLGVLNLYAPKTSWSQTAYDVVHIGGIVLVVAGALLTIATLTALARA
jgi:hypothetical protein